MKHAKKLLALVLAMMMALSVMAVTAAAYETEDAHEHTTACSDEGIMPLGLVGPCKECNEMISIDTSKEEKEVRVNESGTSYKCDLVSIGHTHLLTIYRRSYKCPYCGDKDYSVNTYHTCYGGQ